MKVLKVLRAIILFVIQLAFTYAGVTLFFTIWSCFGLWSWQPLLGTLLFWQHDDSTAIARSIIAFLSLFITIGTTAMRYEEEASERSEERLI